MSLESFLSCNDVALLKEPLVDSILRLFQIILVQRVYFSNFIIQYLQGHLSTARNEKQTNTDLSYYSLTF